MDVDADKGGEIVELGWEIFESVGRHIEIAEILKVANLWRKVCDLVSTCSRSFSTFSRSRIANTHVDSV